MNGTASSPILHQIRRIVIDQALKDSSDQVLLRKFTEEKDEAAFRAILCRHGRMVLDVCRSVLFNEADAEDSFQATFLILAHKARSIQKAKSLGSWLHGVAYRTARRAQAELAKQRKHEARSAVTEASTPEDLNWGEVQRVLHEELANLPERHRTPLILCFLQGKTQDQAALLLGLPKRTLKRRLEEARALLRTRLARRGLAPALLVLVSAWPPAAVASSSVPMPLITSTLNAVTITAAGGTTTAVVSAKVAGLAHGVLKTMFLSRLSIFAVLLTVGLFGVGVGATVFMAATHPGKSQVTQEQDKAVPQDELPDAKRIVGTWKVVSIEINGKVNRDPKSPGLSHGPWVITPAKIIQQGTMFTEKKGYFKGTIEIPYKLDATKSPKELDIIATRADGTDPRQMLGIYALDGDTLKICLAGVDEPRPKEFASKPGSNLVFNILKRQPLGKDAPKARAKDAEGADKASEKNALEELQGEWLVVSKEVRQQKLPLSKNQEILTIKGDKWNAGVERTIRIDSSTTPKTLDLLETGQQGVLKGIYKLEGDTLTYCRSVAGTDRAKEFATTDDDTRVLIVFKRGKGKQAGKQTKPATNTEPPFVAEFAKIKDAMDKLVQDTNEGGADADTEDEKEARLEKAFEVFDRDGTPLAEKALALVGPHVRDPAAVDVLIWILEHRPASPAAVKAADLLIQHHLKNSDTQKTAFRWVAAPMPWTEKMLRALAAADLPRESKGHAIFHLAQCLKATAAFPALLKSLDGHRTARMMELRFGKVHTKELRSADVTKLEAEAIRLFTDAAERYGNEKYGLGTLEEYAKRAVYEIQNLTVGKTAPEIQGEDIDGKPMKLSDYKGKVVVLSFWGHW